MQQRVQFVLVDVAVIMQLQVGALVLRPVEFTNSVEDTFYGGGNGDRWWLLVFTAKMRCFSDSVHLDVNSLWR